MMITAKGITIEVVNESAHTFGSRDNVRTYQSEIDLCKEKNYRHSSQHGLMINGEPVAVFAACGGATGVHDHSAILLEGCLYMAVGDYVVSFEVSTRKMKWALRTDDFTCFGVHYGVTKDALISHGELEISRFSREGKILWAFSGADIFTEGVSLLLECVEAVDFNGKRYRLDYGSGQVVT